MAIARTQHRSAGRATTADTSHPQLGATAPLAPFPEDTEKEAIASGWEERPVGRMRLRGEESDAEDNMLKELLIAVTLLNYRSAATASLLESNGADLNEERADSESAGQLQVKFCVHAYVFCMSWKFIYQK